MTERKTVQEDLLYLTQDIDDVRHKAFLRPALQSHLLRAKHGETEVAAALDEFFLPEGASSACGS